MLFRSGLRNAQSPATFFALISSGILHVSPLTCSALFLHLSQANLNFLISLPYLLTQSSHILLFCEAGFAGGRFCAAVGSGVGASVGSAVGSGVGSRVGASVGSAVGTAVGSGVGARVGSAVGSGVGTGVGARVGAAVGGGVLQVHPGSGVIRIAQGH